MPQPPDASLLNRYLFENPWPAAIVLLVVGLALLWNGMREGMLPRIRLGAVLGLLGAAILGTGFLVVTPGERAKAITRQLVAAVVAKDRTADILFADSAAMSFGSPSNPGFDMEFIIERLNRLADRYTIDSNSITMLRCYTESDEVGVVFLGCMTSADQMPGYAVTQWVIRVQKQPDGSWKITRLTWVSLNDQKPQPGMF